MLASNYHLVALEVNDESDGEDCWGVGEEGGKSVAGVIFAFWIWNTWDYKAICFCFTCRLGLCTVMTNLHIRALVAGLWNIRGEFMYLLTLITVVIGIILDCYLRASVGERDGWLRHHLLNCKDWYEFHFEYWRYLAWLSGAFGS